MLSLGHEPVPHEVTEAVWSASSAPFIVTRGGYCLPRTAPHLLPSSPAIFAVVTAKAVLETVAPTPTISSKRGIIMTSADEIRSYLAVIIEEDAEKNRDHLKWLEQNPQEPDREQQR